MTYHSKCLMKLSGIVSAGSALYVLLFAANFRLWPVFSMVFVVLVWRYLNLSLPFCFLGDIMSAWSTKIRIPPVVDVRDLVTKPQHILFSLWRAWAYDWFLPRSSLLLYLPGYWPHGSWLSVLMESPLFDLMSLFIFSPPFTKPEMPCATDSSPPPSSGWISIYRLIVSPRIQLNSTTFLWRIHIISCAYFLWVFCCSHPYCNMLLYHMFRYKTSSLHTSCWNPWWSLFDETKLVG